MSQEAAIPPTSPSGTYVQERTTEVRGGRPQMVEYWAFIPNTLPPKQAWSAQTINRLNDAMFALGQLGGLSHTRPGAPLPHRHLVRPLLFREATLSSRIEGTRASLGDALAYRPDKQLTLGLESGAPTDDVRSVVNYLAALEHGLAYVAERPITLTLVRDLQSMVVDETLSAGLGQGAFRESQNFVGYMGESIRDAIYIPPPALAVHGLMQDLIDYLRDDDPSSPLLARVAFVHYHFEAIHPFLDGNGRVGRILMVLMLNAWGLLPQPLLNLSAWFERNRPRYYESLKRVTVDGAWEAWVEFFLQGVHHEALAAVQRIERIVDVQDRWRARVAHLRTAGRLNQAIEYLMSNPITTVRELEAHLHVTYRTASKLLEVCMEQGIVRILNDEQYRKLYVAQDLMDAINLDPGNP